jgi:SAM-dependent methyltransferase
MSYAHVLSPELGNGPDIHGLRLVCPKCRYPLGELFVPDALKNFSFICGLCKNEVYAVDGIWRALLPHRSIYFRNFMMNYQGIRSAEGRGSATAEFYVNLPYKDITGANQRQWSIRARTFEYFEREILPKLEAGRGSLDVLDLGAGNGWLSYRLALRGHNPVAVDLMTDSRDGLGAAQQFSSALPKLFPRLQADLDNLPLADSQFDIAIFNASFHYSEDYLATLGEAVRCVKPRGEVIIADTAWYSSEASGTRMIAERRARFIERFGTASDAIRSLEFLTDTRLKALEEQFGLRWQVHTPHYGFRWAMRPVVAKLRGKREPSTFRIYVAEVKK